jgi:hypothetical protein
MTTASATFVGETPGMVGYGGKVTVGSTGVVVVDAADMAIIRAAGAAVVSPVFELAFSLVAPGVSAVSVLASMCSAARVSAAGAAVCAVAVDDFSLPSVSGVFSGVGVVVPELVSVGVGFSVVGSVVGFVGVSFETVVPEPPEALTDDVGPSPEVVVVVCEPEVVGAVVVSVVVLPDVPEAPEVVAPEALPLVVSVFGPLSEFADGSEV